MTLDVRFTPIEFAALAGRALPDTLCVVFDVLRATSTLVTALSRGARMVVPVETIEEALACRGADAGVILAGEREGLRIGAARTGGVAFDLGNSPREFTPERVAGRTVVMTTTNGTRALRACAGAACVLAGAFLNLGALADAVRRSGLPRVVLVCSGTGEAAAHEDLLAAGALCDLLGEESGWDDSARIAAMAWRGARAGGDWKAEVRRSRNARRLLAIPDLADDVGLCLELDASDLVPVREGHGFVATSARAERRAG